MDACDLLVDQSVTRRAGGAHPEVDLAEPSDDGGRRVSPPPPRVRARVRGRDSWLHACRPPTPRMTEGDAFPLLPRAYARACAGRTVGRTRVGPAAAQQPCSCRGKVLGITW
jgi:hypothetical protein